MTQESSPRLTSTLGALVASKRLAIPSVAAGKAFLAAGHTAWFSLPDGKWEHWNVPEVGVYAKAMWRGVRKIDGQSCDVFQIDETTFLAQAIRKG